MAWLAFVVEFVFISSALWVFSRTSRAHSARGNVAVIVFLVQWLGLVVLWRQKFVVLAGVWTVICISLSHWRGLKQRLWRQEEFSLALQERFVSELAARLRLGEGVRAATQKILTGREFSPTAVVSVLAEGSQPKSSLETKFRANFLRLEEYRHLAVPSVMAWRDRLKMEKHFRQKIDQVLLQIRVQAAVAAGIYALALIWSVREHGLGPMLGIVGVASLGVALGVWLIFKGGQRIKWTF